MSARIHAVALAAIAMAMVTACEDDGPVHPKTTTSSAESIASRPLVDKPQFYFNGILFSGTHDSVSSEIYSVNPDGSGLFRLTNDSLTDVYPDVSPAGPRFAWARFDPNTQTSEIFSQNFDGSKRKRLTFLNTVSISPRYSPDGTKIVFKTNRDVNL